MALTWHVEAPAVLTILPSSGYTTVLPHVIFFRKGNTGDVMVQSVLAPRHTDFSFQCTCRPANRCKLLKGHIMSKVFCRNYLTTKTLVLDHYTTGYDAHGKNSFID